MVLAINSGKSTPSAFQTSGQSEPSERWQNSHRPLIMANTNKTAFLICPIGKSNSTTNQRSRELLRKIVKPTLSRFGFETTHFLDPDYTSDSMGIRRLMRERIQDSDVCIADLTENNPQVFFEYGLRRATGRPVLAFIQEGDRLLFDVDDYYTSPYELTNPEPAIRAIEEFLNRKGFGTPSLAVTPERYSQTEEICDYIRRNKPKRIDVLHLSLTSAKELFDAVRSCPEVVIRLLLMHPDEAARYALGPEHSEDVRRTERVVKRNSQAVLTYGGTAPSVGLWYYRHEPSMAAFIVDETLIQLGWYLREPVPGDSSKMRIHGHTQPGLILRAEYASELLPKVRDHFNAVWVSAEPASLECFSGPKANDLLNRN